MQVEKLKELADTVRKGYHKFGSWNMALNMQTVFKNNETGHLRYLPVRSDLGPDLSKYNCSGCLVGFTLFLNNKQGMALIYHDEDFSVENCTVEASHILGLDHATADLLFFGSVSPSVTGEDAYRVLRAFLITGKVDWFLIHR